MATPLKIAELDHIVLRCGNQPRAIDFYTRILGLKEERRLDVIGLVQLRAGASMIDLMPGVALANDAARNVDHFCLGIEAEDMQEVMRYMREQEVEVIGEPTARYGARGTGLSLYIRDPEGNVVELKQIGSSK